jgi:septum formation protein
MSARRVVLASTSRYRASLLQRLLPSFEQAAPGVDEAVQDGEPPRQRAERLARAKADAVAPAHADCLVIGSDQVAALDGRLLDKPGDVATARAQLLASSARTVRFHTAVCVIDTRARPFAEHAHCDLTQAHFRALQDDEIARYIEREQPLDCAGSFKCEALGISLFERIDTSDPTALIGLPLIALARLLRQCGLQLP